MQSMTPQPISLRESRFSRLESIRWWKQPLLQRARILVVGAGALGNEVVKNLAMLGVGHITIADMDRVEESNLTRSILFRARDAGRLKAEVAAEAARDIYPEIEVEALGGNILAELGLGRVRSADMVIGALDNREARVFLNSACARVGRPWIDGGIDVLQGIVRGFRASETACYECTMGQADWDLLNKRRSCGLLARRAAAERGTPTTPTTASIIAALQVQEVVKFLHGMDWLCGKGLVFDGAGHNSFAVSYQRNPECPWHEAAPEIAATVDSDAPLRSVVAEAERIIGQVDALDLSRELVASMRCPACGEGRDVYCPVDRVDEADVVCRRCGVECNAEPLHSIAAGSALLERSASEIGLPAWDIVFARGGDRVVGVEFGSRKQKAENKKVEGRGWR